jgi:hypothetical protein
MITECPVISEDVKRERMCTGIDKRNGRINILDRNDWEDRPKYLSVDSPL